nr:MAG: hypothetical protein DIU60_13190 [Actinomycetota bacterium]
MLDVGGAAAVDGVQRPAVPGDVAAAAGLSAETVRKIETGRIPTPALFTVAALAKTLGISLDELVAACEAPAALPCQETDAPPEPPRAR